MLLIVILLGIGAGAALYSTMGTARLDKRSALNDTAKMLAQTAVEEILVKITNNSSDFVEDKRYLFTPFATVEMGKMQGFEVGQVQVLGRLAEAPEDPAALDHFLELITAGPGFASKEVYEGVENFDETLDWRKRLPDYFDADAGKPFKDLFMMKVEGKDLDLKEMKGKGEEYHESEWKEYHERSSNNFQDGGKIRNGFWELEPLEELKWWEGDITLSHFNGDTKDTADGDMKQFMEKWDETMDYVADRVANRIAGCAGNPNYGVGAMLSAIVLGGASDADSQAEEEFRETSQDGGLLEYRSHLVSIQGEAKTRVGTVAVNKAITAHRIVARMNFKVAMDMLRNQTVPYLMMHYNLTPRDLEILGWVTIQYKNSGDVEPADASDIPESVTIKKDLFTLLTERYPDNPNPRVVPFQAATCLYKNGGY